jgi:hypothetical protein
MKNIKDITLLAFAVVGFYTIITAFSSTESNQPQPQQVYGTPESHVWEMWKPNTSSYFSFNKKTGEVRSYSIVNTADERKMMKTGKGNELIYRSAIKVNNAID